MSCIQMNRSRFIISNFQRIYRASSRCILAKFGLPDVVILLIFCADIEFDAPNNSKKTIEAITSTNGAIALVITSVTAIKY